LIANVPALLSMMATPGALVALSWVVVALAYAGILRIAFKAPFRRDLASFPAMRGWLLGGCLVGTLASVWLLSRLVLLHYLVAAASLAGMAWLWWRARPTYGRSRGWPAGSLGIGASLDAIDNRDYYLEQAARHGPIFKMSQFGRPVLCVVGLARGRQLLQDHRASLGPATLPYNKFVGIGMLRYIPRESHHTEGPLFRRALATPTLERSEPEARATLRQRLAVFAQTGGDIRPVIRSWTVELLATAFFGLHATDRRVRTLDAAQNAMNLQLTSGRKWSEAIQRSLVSAVEVVREAAQELRRTGESASVLGALVAPPRIRSATKGGSGTCFLQRASTVSAISVGSSVRRKSVANGVGWRTPRMDWYLAAVSPHRSRTLAMALASTTRRPRRCVSIAAEQSCASARPRSAGNRNGHHPDRGGDPGPAGPAHNRRVARFVGCPRSGQQFGLSPDHGRW
jgi:hypothetical protein